MRIAHKQLEDGMLVCYKNGWATSKSVKDKDCPIIGVYDAGEIVVADKYRVTIDDPTS